MRERLEDMLGGVARAIWILTFHAACGRILRREASRLGYRSNFTIYDQADQIRLTKSVPRGAGPRPEALRPARHPRADLDREEQPRLARGVRPTGLVLLRPDRRRRVRPLPAAALRLERASTSTTCSSSPSSCSRTSPRRGRSGADAFRYILVDEYQDTNHAQYRLLQLLAEKHKNLFVVAIRTSPSTRSAEPTSATSWSSRRDFPGTRVIPLEQNYRSTNTILRGSNTVIANNRERKPKELWSELGEGEPMHVLEVEDEHAEARFVAVEIARLVEEDFNGSEIAVFYRTNAQSRVLEDVLVRQAIQYQVVGGPRFYERAEIKDVIAYLQVIDNPYDAVSLMRIANRPRRGIGDTSIARLQTYADAHGISLWEATEFPEEAGVGAAPLKAVQALRTLLQSLMAGAMELTVPGARPARARAERLHRRARGRAHDRGAGAASRTSRSSSGWRRSTRPPPTSRASPSFLQEISLFSDQDALRGRAEPRHADDAAQREGARVPGRLHDRDGGGDLPALALDRGGDARGGAAARVRRA